MACSVQQLMSQAAAFGGLDYGQLQIAGLRLLCLKKGGACNPIDLLASASQFSGLNPLELEMVIAKLFCILASESCDVQALLDDSASVFGLDPGQVQVITTELLCQWYGGDCTVSDLLEEGSCFLCLEPGQKRVVFAQLLCEIAGNDCGTVQSLLSEAACLGCLNIAQLLNIQTNLLCTLVGGGGGGCGAQISSATLVQTATSMEVSWTPTNQGITLTIERQINGGSWVIITTGVSDALGSFEGGESGVVVGDTVIFRIRRDGTAASCAVESNSIEFLDFGNFPNDSFESYTNNDLLISNLQGGEHGDDGSFIILWESEYKNYPYGGDVFVTSPDGVLNLVQWVKADAITGVTNNDALNTWEDQTVNNNDFTAAGAQRPTYQTNQLNGMAGVLFNNVAGVGMTGAVNQAAGNFSIIVVYRSANIATVTGRRCVQGGTGNWLIGPYAGLDRVFTGTTFLTIGYNNVNPLVAAVVQVGTTSARAFLNGALAGIMAAGLVQPGLIDLGATGANNEPANCHIFEVCVYNAALTDDDIAAISWGLMLKWGIGNYPFDV